jgi:hypothetical protein
MSEMALALIQPKININLKRFCVNTEHTPRGEVEQCLVLSRVLVDVIPPL